MFLDLFFFWNFLQNFSFWSSIRLSVPEILPNDCFCDAVVVVAGIGYSAIISCKALMDTSPKTYRLISWVIKRGWYLIDETDIGDCNNDQGTRHQGENRLHLQIRMDLERFPVKSFRIVDLLFVVMTACHWQVNQSPGGGRTSVNVLWKKKIIFLV